MDERELSPLEAFAEFERVEDATYVDVRTVAEFAVRHPAAARVVNVPIVFFHPTTKATHPNDAFLLVMNDVFPRDARLILGADDGPRAADAARVLRDDGFTNVALMHEGYGGWARYDLPVTADNRPGTSYVSLLTAARRRKSA